MVDNGVFRQRQAHPPKRMAKGPLRFGIDIDGTISQAPRHFKRLIDALLDRDNEVFIITGRKEDMRDETVELLDFFGIRYSELLMRPNDWRGSVAEFKVKMVSEHGVHMMIDDDAKNCWAIEQETEALAALMLPIPEMPAARAVKSRLRKFSTPPRRGDSRK